MLPEVDKILEPGSDLKDMSPEEQAFYTDPSSVERAEWQKEQNKIVSVAILQLNIIMDCCISTDHRFAYLSEASGIFLK